MIRVIVGAIILFNVMNAMGLPKIIAALGPTERVLPYQIQFLFQKKTKIQNKIKAPKYYRVNYRVRTKELTPNSVKPRKVDIKNLIQPIYIIGDDALSKKWLAKYKKRLKAVHAIGFIVNVKNNENYVALSKKFNIQPIPVNGRDFAKRFGIKHYPVLISRYRIEQ